jgi:phosphomevalonate kinase
MTPICVSAPGKAVISGEYAVLFGAPALVSAINRRATVCIADSDDEFHRVSVPGLAGGCWRFRAASGGRIAWRDEVAGGLLDLFECIWRHCAVDSTSPVSIEIDTRAFFDRRTGLKLGLGSSAATTAALAGALNSLSGDGRGVWPLARRIHRDFQSGRGSGVDVAASVFGGLLAYRAGNDRPPRSLAWPRGLYCRFLWSGTASDTREKLQQLANRECTELASFAEGVLTAWDAGLAGEIMYALNRYLIDLARFSDNLDLGIFDAGHGEMVALARACNAVYKPCGAGGGDIGVVIAETLDAVEEFCSMAARQGFAVPGIECDPQGMTELEKD